MRYNQESPWEKIGVDVRKLINLRKIAVPWEIPQLLILEVLESAKNNCAMSKALKKVYFM